MNTNIGIIGAGHMGSCLLGGLIKHGYHPANLWISDIHPDKLVHLKNTFEINTTIENQSLLTACDIIVLAVKPQFIKDILISSRHLICGQAKLIISIAAGIRIQTLEKWLQGEVSIVRAMPNTPALIRSGATALIANKKVTRKEREAVEAIMQAVGITTWLAKEEWMDIVTGLSGSGPAYFFFVMESLQKAAEKLGLPADIASMLVIQTALGAAKMAKEGNAPLSNLIKQVTSPGGTTEAGLNILTQEHAEDLFEKVLNAASNRSKELEVILSKEEE